MKYLYKSLQQPCLLEKSTLSRRNVSGSYSSNWSGYALSGSKGMYNRVSGSWIVPYVRPSSTSSYSSAWIGIDGYLNSSLIQTGTGHDFVHGKPYYYAWWEILPAFATIIPHPVHPGDCMKAIIVKRTCTKWLICLKNLTRNWTFRTVQQYSGPQSSAEWIVEAPEVGRVNTRLANLTPVIFKHCRVNGKIPKLSADQRVTMVQNGRVVSLPTQPSKSGDAFVVRSAQSRST